MSCQQKMIEKSEQIINVYSLFGIKVKKLIAYSFENGIAKFDFEVEPNTDFSKIRRYRDDVSLMLSVPPVTLISPLPDKSAFQIEVPIK